MNLHIQNNFEFPKNHVKQVRNSKYVSTETVYADTDTTISCPVQIIHTNEMPIAHL